MTRGSAAAANPNALRTSLQAAGIRLISLQQPEEKAAPTASSWNRYHPSNWLRPGSRQVELCLRQIAMMLRSGLDLMSAIKATREQASSMYLAKVLEAVSDKVRSGSTLAAAMEHFKLVFPPIAVQLVHVGEQTGHLSEVLEQAADHMAQRRTALSDIRMALAYPMVVATGALSIAVYLVFSVIPQLKKFLDAMGRKLPKMTQSLIDLAEWLQMNQVLCIFLFIASVAAMYLLYKWPKSRFKIDQWILRAPIIGGILRLSATATFASALAIMTRSGVKLVDALVIVRRLQPNRYLAHRVDEAAEAIQRGEPMAEQLAVPNGYIPMLASMIQVAEQTGQLDSTMDDVAKFCQTELQSRLKRVSAMLEPAIIITSGGVVGYVYMAFFMALMSTGGNFR